MRPSWPGSVSALLVLGVAAFSGADWQRDYLKAVSKVESRQYAEAIPLLQRALQEKPASCTSCIREGMYFSDYFPKFYLGQAYLGTGQTEEAMSALKALKQEGTIQGNSRLSGAYNNLLQMAQQETRASKPPSPTPAERTAEKAPEKPAMKPAEKAQEKNPEKPVSRPPAPTEKPAEPPRKESPAPATPKPEPQARQASPSPAFDPAALEALKAKLSRIRGQLEDVNPTVLQGFPGFASLHRKLADRLGQGLQRADKVQKRKDIDDLDWFATRLQGNVRRFLDAFEKAKNLRDAFTALPEETLKQFPDLHRQYALIRDRINDFKSSAHDWESDQPYQELMQAMDRTQREVADLTGLFSAKLAEASRKPAPPAPVTAAASPSTSRPSPAAAAPAPKPAINAAAILKDAFASYFRGDFSAADASLKSLEYLNISHPYLHFLRAVLAGSRYFAGGEQDAALAQKARDSFKKARAAGLPSAAISENCFSPKLIAFLQEK